MFRVQSTLEYPTDELEVMQFIPEDYEIDLRFQYEFHEILRRDGSPFANSMPVTGELDPRHNFIELAERFLIQARLASDGAHSYRNFNVGALILTEREPGLFGVFYGANLKLDPHGPKICAERLALEKATQAGHERVIGIAVYGPAQEDHGSGLALPVLHPCEACRERFIKSPIVSERTLIAAANPQGQYEFTDVKTILALHEEGIDPDEINTHRVKPEAARALIRMSILGGWIPDHTPDETS